MNTQTSSYLPRRASTVEQLTIRGAVPYRIHRWVPANGSSLNAPPLLLAHGWMDVGASFQRCVDYLSPGREVIALDWRGFGGSRGELPIDSYSFHDYYGDLDAIVDYISPNSPIDLLGHSMGGNIVMVYAGTRPTRIRRLINVEGFGLAKSAPSEAPTRLAQWLSELKSTVSLRTFSTEQEIVDHLKIRSPRLEAGYGAWLASQWAELQPDGRWHIMADAAHKRVNPVPYQSDEAVAAWKKIQAPVLWVEGENTGHDRWSGDKYPRSEFEDRLSKVPSVERTVIAQAGHMIHLEQPEALATAIEDFLSR